MKRTLNFLLNSVTAIALPIAAEENVLMIDQMPDKSVQLAFPNERNIQPKAGDFIVLNYVPMSSEDGDRWAIVTLKNTSSGSRIFESQYLIGLFADGERRAPSEYKQSLNGSEIVSVTLAFGRHKFPLLSVMARD